MQDKKPNVFRRNVDAVANPEGQSDEQRRSTRGVLLGVLIGLVVLGLITWAIRVFVFEPNEAEAPPAATSVPSEEPAPAPSPSVTGGAGDCSLDTSNADVSTEPPVAEQWVAVRYSIVPEVDGAGPCEEGNNYQVGFAPTMTGSVVAALHYAANLYVTAPVEGTRELAEYAFVDGPIKDSLLQQIDDVNNGVQPRTEERLLEGGERLGYQVADYSSESAVIEILGRTTGGGYWSATVRLEWVDGDWRIDPATGSSWTAQREISGTTGYVLWGPSTDSGS